MRVRLTQIDGAMPNLALMKLAHWHKARGDECVLTTSVERDLFEGNYDKVYGSAIFKFSAERIERFRHAWPDAIIGGTGTDTRVNVEDVIGVPKEKGWAYERFDYVGIGVDYSIGFTQRGCRLKCEFCVVPWKEGANVTVNTIAGIWRGEGHPKKLHLLDNDYFGQPRKEWEASSDEIISGGFKVCMSQGINVRLIDDDAAATLARMNYRSADFQDRRLYTAWDNLGNEKVFFRGIEKLAKAGIPPTHVMAYMLIGFAGKETWRDIWYRYKRMRDLGILPYPMVYDRSRADLLCFARWAKSPRLYSTVEWPDYIRSTKSADSVKAWKEIYAAAA